MSIFTDCVLCHNVIPMVSLYTSEYIKKPEIFLFFRRYRKGPVARNGLAGLFICNMPSSWILIALYYLNFFLKTPSQSRSIECLLCVLRPRCFLPTFVTNFQIFIGLCAFLLLQFWHSFDTFLKFLQATKQTKAINFYQHDFWILD